MERRKIVAAVLLGLILVAVVLPCAAEEITPLGTEWSFERKAGSGAQTCNLILTMVNIPASPESVNVHFIVGAMGNASVYGFTLDVGDMFFKNGQPERIDKVPIQSAQFLSQAFNSPGRMFAADAGDGGIMISTRDPNTAAEFLKVVLGGDFKIAFKRDGGTVSRLYAVHQRASPADLSQYAACASNALPH
jgi:hypothetical protein